MNWESAAKRNNDVHDGGENWLSQLDHEEIDHDRDPMASCRAGRNNVGI